MQKYITIILLFFGVICFAQQKEKKSDLKFNDGIFKGSITLSTKISDKWSIEGGSEAQYNLDANSMAVPVRFKYKINQKLNVFAGQLFYHTKNINTFNNLKESPRFGTTTQLGLENNFTNEINAKLYYQHNFNAAKNFDSGLYNLKNKINLSVGYRF